MSKPDLNDYVFIDGTRLSSVIEALIFASNEPISGSKIRQIITENEEQIEIDEETVDLFVDKLNQRYEENGLSFGIELIGGGYTFVTQEKFHYWLSIFQHENAYRKLSQSAIETLAIVAYRQPITKPEVDQIRGVDSGYIIRQLMEKALIEVAGRADSQGKPLLYKTTRHFLRHFGLNTVEDLPKPREIEEILKDDDMAEHRQLLLERQLMMETDEEEANIPDIFKDVEIEAEEEELEEIKQRVESEEDPDGDNEDSEIPVDEEDEADLPEAEQDEEE